MLRRTRMIAFVLGAAACTSGAEPDGSPDPSRTVVHDDLVYSAQTAILESFPVQLSTAVTVRNPTASARGVAFPDGCVVLLRVYERAERSGAPAWDQRRAVGCTQAVVQREIGPGESVEFEGRASAGEILGDSLPDGRYYLSALLRPTGDAIEVPAGSAELAVPR